MDDDIPRTDRPRQPGEAEAPAWLPWVWRAAETLLVAGPAAIALRARDPDEQRAILAAVVELVRVRHQRRPHARRRAA